MNIYLEIFGYIGTALVILSMMMTSVLKLRIFNMCGSLISLIYSACVSAWPVVVLNACMLCINFVQTVRQLKKREDVTLITVGENGATARHLFGIWQKDVQKHHFGFDFESIKEEETHILYVGEEAVGFFANTNGDPQNQEGTLYLTPAYCNETMKARVLAMLAKQNQQFKQLGDRK